VAIPSATELLDLSGRAAVVTGGGRGIGYATAERLARAGAAVVVADVDPAGAESAARLAADGLDVTYSTLDVTDPAQHEALAARVDEEYDGLDIWINNAGVFPNDAALEMSDATWRRVLDVNTNGAFFGARAAGRRMVPRGSGVIVNLLSVSAFRVSGDGRAHYAASKGAVRSLTQALARELGPRGVRVLGVAPTSIATPGVLEGGMGDAGLRDYASRLPLRRYGEPDDVARVVLFAVSDLASLMTGSVLAVDAGQMAV
jgi:NAD(P)-dependent dehydrogenase (short-subunit alcohol dehydrogenase family)